MENIRENRRLKNVRYEFRHNRQAMFAAIYLIAITLVCLLVVFFPLDPDAIDVTAMLEGPSAEHWFGTDEVGRDYFARIIYGGRVSLLVGFLAMFTSLAIGVSVGISAGYFGGIVDNLLMRVADIFASIPYLIIVITINMLFTRGLVSIVIAIGLFSWMEIARIVRAETLSLKEREYMQYAEFIGTSPLQIMIRQVIPAVSPSIITASSAAIAGAIMTETTLSFLGMGVQQPMSSWGSLLQSAQGYLARAPYMAILPGILIILTIYSFNKLGDVLRVFAEPRVTEVK